MKAIRVEATEAKNNYEEQNSIGRSFDRGLNNPFIETHSTFSWKDKPRPRFDYYTDPMADSSVNTKRRTTVLRFYTHVTHVK